MDSRGRGNDEKGAGMTNRPGPPQEAAVSRVLSQYAILTGIDAVDNVRNVVCGTESPRSAG